MQGRSPKQERSVSAQSIPPIRPLPLYWADWAEVILPEGHRFPMVSSHKLQPLMLSASFSTPLPASLHPHLWAAGMLAASPALGLGAPFRESRGAQGGSANFSRRRCAAVF